MKEDNTAANPLFDLRQRAEDTLRAQPQDLEALSPDAAQGLFHELRVHQVELEMQNEELRRASEELEASRARVFDLYDLVPVGYFTTSEKGLILEANLTGASLLGVARSHLIKQPLPRFIASQDQDIYYTHRQRLFETQSPAACELRMVRADGSQFWARVEATAGQERESGAPFLRAIVSDISERKRADEALRETNEYLDNLLNYANAPIIVWDPQFQITRFNHAFESLTGRSAEDVIGESLEILFPLTLVESSMELIKKTLGGERWETVEIAILHVDGSVRTVLWNSATILGPDGKSPVATIAQGHDITERKQAEAALRASEERFRLMLDVAPVPLVLTRLRDGTFQYINVLAAEMAGIPPAEAIGKPAAGFYADPSQRLAIVAEIQRTGAARNVEVLLKRANGETFWALLSAALTSLQGEPVFLAGITDISARKQADDAVRESEEKYRTLFDTMAGGVVYQDDRGVIISANHAAERILGLSLDQMQGRTSMDPRWRAIREDGSDFPGEEHPSMVALRTGREVHNVIMGVFHPEIQDHVWIRINAVPQFRPGDNRPYQSYATFDDINERKQAEAALRERTLELEARNQELQTAISTIRTLSGIVPICAWCGRRIQDDKGDWVNVETYLEAHGDVTFTHGMCPDCYRKSMAELKVTRQKIE